MVECMSTLFPTYLIRVLNEFTLLLTTKNLSNSFETYINKRLFSESYETDDCITGECKAMP